MDKQESLKELETLENIGRISAEKLKAKSGGKLDRCVLYQFRGAKLGKPWWTCKDKK